MAKLPNDLSPEELAAILKENQDVKEETAPKDNIALFVSTFGLQEGTLKIPVKLVYLLYKEWAKAPLTPNGFYQKIALLLPNKHVSGGKVSLLLNKDTLKLNEELYKLLSKKVIKKTKSEHYQKHFDKFLKMCKIEDGTNWISCRELHKTYLSWAKKNFKQNPLGLKNFEAMCKLYFKFRTTEKTLEVAIRKG